METILCRPAKGSVVEITERKYVGRRGVVVEQVQIFSYRNGKLSSTHWEYVVVMNDGYELKGLLEDQLEVLELSDDWLRFYVKK